MSSPQGRDRKRTDSIDLLASGEVSIPRLVGAHLTARLEQPPNPRQEPRHFNNVKKKVSAQSKIQMLRDRPQDHILRALERERDEDQASLMVCIWIQFRFRNSNSGQQQAISMIWIKGRSSICAQIII